MSKFKKFFQNRLKLNSKQLFCVTLFSKSTILRDTISPFYDVIGAEKGAYSLIGVYSGARYTICATPPYTEVSWHFYLASTLLLKIWVCAIGKKVDIVGGLAQKWKSPEGETSAILTFFLWHLEQKFWRQGYRFRGREIEWKHFQWRKIINWPLISVISLIIG